MIFTTGLSPNGYPSPKLPLVDPPACSPKSPALSFPVGQITKAWHPRLSSINTSLPLTSSSSSIPLSQLYLHPLGPSPPPWAIFPSAHLHHSEPSPSPSAIAITFRHRHRHPLPSPFLSVISITFTYPKDSPILIFLGFPLPIRIVPGSSICRSPMVNSRSSPPPLRYKVGTAPVLPSGTWAA